MALSEMAETAHTVGTEEWYFFLFPWLLYFVLLYAISAKYDFRAWETSAWVMTPFPIIVLGLYIGMGIFSVPPCSSPAGYCSNISCVCGNLFVEGYVFLFVSLFFLTYATLERISEIGKNRLDRCAIQEWPSPLAKEAQGTFIEELGQTVVHYNKKAVQHRWAEWVMRIAICSLTLTAIVPQKSTDAEFMPGEAAAFTKLDPLHAVGFVGAGMLGTIGCLWRVNWDLRHHKLMAFVALCYVGFFLIFVVCQINYGWLATAIDAYQRRAVAPHAIAPAIAHRARHRTAERAVALAAQRRRAARGLADEDAAGHVPVHQEGDGRRVRGRNAAHALVRGDARLGQRVAVQVGRRGDDRPARPRCARPCSHRRAHRRRTRAQSRFFDFPCRNPDCEVDGNFRMNALGIVAEYLCVAYLTLVFSAALSEIEKTENAIKQARARPRTLTRAHTPGGGARLSAASSSLARQKLDLVDDQEIVKLRQQLNKMQGIKGKSMATAGKAVMATSSPAAARAAQHGPGGPSGWGLQARPGHQEKKTGVFSMFSMQ